MRALVAVALSLGLLVGAIPTIGAFSTGTATAATQPDDPAQDVIGWEDGYWHNESINVDQSDGLNNSELDAFVARAMARVEYLRDREFKQSVPVEVMTREEYRNLTGSSGGDNQSAYAAWNNQVWEGLFIVGESTNVQDELSSTTGSAVAGFYSPTRDEITIITENTSSPVISNATLIHELVHALQDQYFDLSSSRYYEGVDGTQDASLAVSGLIEGEANYVEAKYTDRCGAAWSCVSTPQQGDGGSPADINFGILVTLFNPYSDGPVWVHNLVENDGWDALEARYDNIPVSTEQIIHVTDEEPEPMDFTDTAVNGWDHWPQQGVNGADTVGEASIYAMFWYQSRNYNAGIVDWRSIADVDGEYDTYDYSHEASAGWANDLLVPYHKGTGADADYGYVWKTRWDTEQDAVEFRDAYLQILRTHDAIQEGPNTWVIEDPPFADAFHVIRDGRTVTIVNGPTVSALTDIRPSITIGEMTSTTTTISTTTTTTTTTTPSTTTTPTTETTTTTTSGDGGPGFGLALAVVAVLLATLGVRVRR